MSWANITLTANWEYAGQCLVLMEQHLRISPEPSLGGKRLIPRVKHRAPRGMLPFSGCRLSLVGLKMPLSSPRWTQVYKTYVLWLLPGFHPISRVQKKRFCFHLQDSMFSFFPYRKLHLPIVDNLEKEQATGPIWGYSWALLTFPCSHQSFAASALEKVWGTSGGWSLLHLTARDWQSPVSLFYLQCKDWMMCQQSK